MTALATLCHVSVPCERSARILCTVHRVSLSLLELYVAFGRTHASHSAGAGEKREQGNVASTVLPGIAVRAQKVTQAFEWRFREIEGG